MSQHDDSGKKPDNGEVQVTDLSSVHPADAAEHLETLSLDQQMLAVEQLGPENAADSIAEMSEAEGTALLASLDPQVAGEILSEMDPDDAADLVHGLPREQQAALLNHVATVDTEQAADIRTLMAYDPETAGGVMTTAVVELDEHLTVDEAIQIIRRGAEDMEIPYYAYLVDDAEHLVGVLSMRDLLVSRPGTILRALIQGQSLVSVTFDVDKEEVAQLLSRYNFLAIPVVDYEDKLLGVVTVDDVIDIIHEEATEDMQKMVGAGSDETADSPWHYSVKKRLPWLVINLFTSYISATVVAMFEGTIAQMAFLAVLMPIVSNQAGNTGQQALAVMVRQLALEKFDARRSVLAVVREVYVGLATGLGVAVVAFGSIMVINPNVPMALIFAVSTFLDMVLGVLAGVSIPLILRYLGRDPAQASCIFLTTLTDTFGFSILLILARMFLLP